MRTLSQITKEEIIQVISESKSYSEVFKRLEVNKNGGNQSTLKRFIIDNNISIEHFKQNVKPEKHFCLNCGQEIVKSNKYCNNQCKCDYEYKQYINRWKQGLESGTKGKDDVSNYVRRYLFEKHNNSCELCGWNLINPYTNLTPLQIHHIDGNCLNNSEENLQLLCPNCHALTENFGSRNENCTRVDKRLR